jgi:hypothetical protein
MSYQPLDGTVPASSKAKKWLDDHGFGVLHGEPRAGLFVVVRLRFGVSVFTHTAGPITPLIISIVSGLINGMLLFSFAAVFASLIFNTFFERYTGIGLNMFTGSGLITGLIGIKYSQFFAGIIGPGAFLFFSLSLSPPCRVCRGAGGAPAAREHHIRTEVSFFF